MEKPDLLGARTFVEAHGSVAQGKWHVLPDRVVFERDTGEFVDPAVVSVHDLENSSTWREADPGD